jgi:hypothetical protein
MHGDLEKLCRVKLVELSIERMLGKWNIKASHKLNEIEQHVFDANEGKQLF